MLIAEAREMLRVDLADTAKTAFTADQLDRAIERAVFDLSRFLPRELVYEDVLVLTVSDEAWTSAAAAGTWVTLDNKPIKYQSEVVKNAAATTCTRDTDYYIDYANGKITHISGGAIGDSESCTVSYTKSEISIDISSILDDLIRIDSVEYPVGNVPQTTVSTNLWGSLLTVLGDEESQSRMTANKHIAVYYKAKHTIPTPAAHGSYPRFLDGTVILAASAYALFTLAMKYDILAVSKLTEAETDLTSAKTALGEITLAAALVALGKVDTYAAGANAPSSKKYLTTGDDEINLVTVGDSVAKTYAEYAEQSANITLAFIEEASQRIQANSILVQEAAGYVSSAQQLQYSSSQLLTIAERFRNEAIERRNEAWAIWRDPNQYVGSYSRVALKQVKTEE